MGGAALLARVRAIGWSGTARISTAAGVIDLGVDTRVEPFVRARCETWLVADGRPSMRTLMIEGHDGFSVNEGRQLPLSPRHAEHERQQFGIYGHMLLAGIATVQGSKIAAARPGLPAALFAVGHDGMLASADYIVDGPDSAATIREHFTFSGMVTDKGLLWPRRIAITRNGTPFFALTIDELAVELSPA